MSNAIEDFLQTLKRTLNGEPYPAVSATIYQPILYKVTAVRDPLEGSLLGAKYRVLVRVGKGAMAVVYKASQEPIDRVVALKVLNSTYSQDPIAVKRFNLEAKTLSSLKHRNILSIHDIGLSDSNQPFFVMEFLDGITLEELIENRGAVPVSRSVQIFAQVCDAMSYAHRQGLIHRDLKPGNIMLVKQENGDELVKLVDFGIVKIKSNAQQRLSQRLTKKGEVWGSPTYMSPEQCMGKELDARSDIYSLGLLMYEALMGVEAFGGEHVGAIVSRQIGEMPASFNAVNPIMRIPERLESIIFKCIQKKREDRYQSMDELKADLESFSRKHGIKLIISAGISRQDLIKPAEHFSASSDKTVEQKADYTLLSKAEARKAPLKDPAISPAGPSATKPETTTEPGAGAQHPKLRPLPKDERTGFSMSKNSLALLGFLVLVVFLGLGISIAISQFNESNKSEKQASQGKVSRQAADVPRQAPPETSKPTPPEAPKPTPPEDPKQAQPEASKPTPPEDPRQAQPEASIEQKMPDSTSEKKFKKKLVSKHNSSRSTVPLKHENELEILENSHLRRRRKNADQQWLDIQEKLAN